MKSEFSSIWSSVIPISNSSPNRPLHDGSTLSREDPVSRFGLGGALAISSLGCTEDCGNGCGILGAEEDLWPEIRLPIPPKRPCDFPFIRAPPACCVTPLEP